ncbi:MAG: hypothetical protein KME46_25745 [Brasilonema angustatum HA4187-MV1]|jgi:hypothetical protein|nr:hypothetical protein [Brasilonema angustatum HA4187-MV1]
MEPMTMTATAIGVLFIKKIGEGAATKVGEQFVEKIRELLSPLVREKASKLLSLLHIKLPNTAKAIEQAPNPPLNVDTVEVEIKRAIQNDGELAQAIQEIDAEVKADPKLAQAVKEVVDDLKSKPLTNQNFINTIEKVANLVQGTGASIKIDSQTIHF